MSLSVGACMLKSWTTPLPDGFAGDGWSAFPEELEDTIEADGRLLSELLELRAYYRRMPPLLSRPVLPSSQFETWQMRAEQTLAFVRRLDNKAV